MTDEITGSTGYHDADELTSDPPDSRSIIERLGLSERAYDGLIAAGLLKAKP